MPVRSLKKHDSRTNLPGPGYYKIKTFLETSKPYHNTSAFIARDKRFKSVKNVSPGPADYSQEIL